VRIYQIASSEDKDSLLKKNLIGKFINVIFHITM
jgi:hypothetical protein